MPKVMKPTEESTFLAKYMSELALQDSNFLGELPSKVAASVLVLSLYYCSVEVHEARVEAVTGYSFSDLQSCIVKLRRTHLESGTSSLIVIKNRYAKEGYMSVANIVPKSLDKLLPKYEDKAPKCAKFYSF